MQKSSSGNNNNKQQDNNIAKNEGETQPVHPTSLSIQQQQQQPEATTTKYTLNNNSTNPLGQNQTTTSTQTQATSSGTSLTKPKQRQQFSFVNSSPISGFNEKKIIYACEMCRKHHKACSGDRPCKRCVDKGFECKDVVRNISRKGARSRKTTPGATSPPTPNQASQITSPVSSSVFPILPTPQITRPLPHQLPLHRVVYPQPTLAHIPASSAEMRQRLTPPAYQEGVTTQQYSSYVSPVQQPVPYTSVLPQKNHQEDLPPSYEETTTPRTNFVQIPSYEQVQYASTIHPHHLHSPPILQNQPQQQQFLQGTIIHQEQMMGFNPQPQVYDNMFSMMQSTYRNILKRKEPATQYDLDQSDTSVADEYQHLAKSGISEVTEHPAKKQKRDTGSHNQQ